MIRVAIALLAIALLPASAGARSFDTSAGPVEVTEITGGLANPWALDFLPDGRALVTEKPGRLRVLENGTLSAPLAGVPDVVARGQGGLLDVAVSPDFATDRTIFLSYAEAAPGGARTAVMRAMLEPGRISGQQVIFRQSPASGSGVHYGSRIVPARDGTLFVTLGDRGDRPAAQRLDRHNGKVVRINRDGSVPPDNPFANRPGALPEIWTLGHRNPQGAALRPVNGTLFTVMHGARGGDEVNRSMRGANYGWPEVSYGKHYSGRKIGIGTSAPSFTGPVHYWDPSIAPSGAVFYDGALFPQWRGDLLVGALKFQLISRLDMDGDRVAGEERLFRGAYGRIRDVTVGPDGAIWFVTDERQGRILRAAPPGR